MYAIIRAGGKQAKVQEGDILDIERVKGSGEVTFYSASDRQGRRHRHFGSRKIREDQGLGLDSRRTSWREDRGIQV